MRVAVRLSRPAANSALQPEDSAAWVELLELDPALPVSSRPSQADLVVSRMCPARLGAVPSEKAVPEAAVAVAQSVVPIPIMVEDSELEVTRTGGQRQ